MKSFCFIPAKLASTRLKKKNILKLNDKELLYYPIVAAQESNLFKREDIIVSSEAKEVRDVATKYGATSFKRDDKLAHDPYGIVDVVLEFLEKSSKYKEYELCFILLPTSPTVKSFDLTKASEIFENTNCKYLMSVNESEHNAQTQVFIKDSFIEPLFKDEIVKKSQELEKTYHINGIVTIVDVKDFLKTKTYFSYPLATYIIGRDRAIDIDTKEDLMLAKLIMDDTSND